MEKNTMPTEYKISLATYLKETPSTKTSLVNYNERAADVIIKNPGLEKKIIKEVQEGAFNKNSKCGGILYVQLCSVIKNSELKKKQKKGRKLRKGSRINTYLSENSGLYNAVKDYIEKYLKENEDFKKMKILKLSD